MTLTYKISQDEDVSNKVNKTGNKLLMSGLETWLFNFGLPNTYVSPSATQ